MRRNILVLTCAILAGTLLSHHTLGAQDVDYDNLTLGIFGDAGEFEPELSSGE